MGRKILIVEDERVIRKFLRVQLNKLGHDVFEAEDGAEAALLLALHRFDLIICDIMMPNKDGWQLMKELKAGAKTKEIPVIILTAKNKDEDMFRAYALGAAYYIPKPFTRAELFYGMELIFDKTPEPLDDYDVSQQFGEIEA